MSVLKIYFPQFKDISDNLMFDSRVYSERNHFYFPFISDDSGKANFGNGHIKLEIITVENG